MLGPQSCLTVMAVLMAAVPLHMAFPSGQTWFIHHSGQVITHKRLYVQLSNNFTVNVRLCHCLFFAISFSFLNFRLYNLWWCSPRSLSGSASGYDQFQSRLRRVPHSAFLTARANSLAAPRRAFSSIGFQQPSGTIWKKNKRDLTVHILRTKKTEKLAHISSHVFVRLPFVPSWFVPSWTFIIARWIKGQQSASWFQKLTAVYIYVYI